MHVVSACSTEPDSIKAVREVAEEVTRGLDGPASLAFWFFHGHFQHDTAKIREQAAWLTAALGTSNLAGCSAQGLVSSTHEHETAPGMVLWAARSSRLEVDVFHLDFVRGADGSAWAGWPEKLAGEWREPGTMIMLADPFSFPADSFLERLNEDRPGTLVYGGMCSGAQAPGESILICGNRVYDGGMTGVRVSGEVTIDGTVSQGCRPIGKPLVVTKAERNEIHELGGLPPLRQIEGMFASLPTREKQIMNDQGGLHIGRVVSEYRETFRAGDFLIRNIMGIDEQSGALVIGDFIRPGQTIQFHLRDAETASADLKRALAEIDAAAGTTRGALLFTCNGRGSHLFGTADHDLHAIRRAWGDIPVAGFFAAGEAGPVGGQNFIHGFTASILRFVERPA